MFLSTTAVTYAYTFTCPSSFSLSRNHHKAFTRRVFKAYTFHSSAERAATNQQTWTWRSNFSVHALALVLVATIALCRSYHSTFISSLEQVGKKVAATNFPKAVLNPDLKAVHAVAHVASWSYPLDPFMNLSTYHSIADETSSRGKKVYS